MISLEETKDDIMGFQEAVESKSESQTKKEDKVEEKAKKPNKQENKREKEEKIKTNTYRKKFSLLMLQENKITNINTCFKAGKRTKLSSARQQTLQLFRISRKILL